MAVVEVMARGISRVKLAKPTVIKGRSMTSAMMSSKTKNWSSQIYVKKCRLP